MRIAHTIPLSLSILWRFALTFPVLLIGLFLYGALGALIGLLVGLILPGSAFIAGFLVSASSGVIPVMVGARFGFQSKLIRPSVGYRKLVIPAVIYGSAEAVAIGLILAPVVGLAVVQVAPDLVELTEAAESPALDWLTSAGASVSVAGLAVMASVFIVASAARASLLVPLAAASLGRDPDDMPYTPFRNFGSGFWPLFGLVVISYVAMLALYVLAFLAISLVVGTTALESGIQEISDMADGTVPLRPVWPVILLFVSFTLIGIWGLSLQCAGAVQTYLKLRGHPNETHTAEKPPRGGPSATPTSPNSDPRMSAQELRAMRKSRQHRD